MIRRPPRSTQRVSSAASDLYERQISTLLSAVNVADYTGTDITAFTAAFNKAIAEHKSVYIPNGEYNLNGWVYSAKGDLQIIGQRKEMTILRGLGSIRTYGDVSLENLSLLDTTGSVLFNMRHSGFVAVNLDNIRVINSDTNFTNTSRANAFMVLDSSGSRGVDELVIKDSTFSGFSSSALRLRCQINEGHIANSVFSEVGYDTNTSVAAIRLGYGDIATGRAKHILFENNSVENIYSAYGSGNETVNAFGMIVYGDYITIKDSTFKNLYGGGREPENINSGYDHEMIYIKGSHILIDNNTVINGSGANSNGAIALKGNYMTDLVITNNYIVCPYDKAIMVNASASDVTITGNRVLCPQNKIVIRYNEDGSDINVFGNIVA